MLQGQEYKLCIKDQRPTAAAPCEMGATAEDEKDGDLTNAVLALPEGVAPADCLERDCTLYRVVAKGLQVGIYVRRLPYSACASELAACLGVGVFLAVSVA